MQATARAQQSVRAAALPVALLIASVSVVVACGSRGGPLTDGGSGSGGGGGASPSCPFPAARDLPWPFAHGSGGVSPSAYCPDGCAPVEAAQLDEGKGCRRWVLLGCIPCANGCGGAPEGPTCTKYAGDGRLINAAPGYAFSNQVGWEACSPAENSAMGASGFCAD